MRRFLLLVVAACGSSHSATTDGAMTDTPGEIGIDGRRIDTPVAAAGRTIFVIPMENQPSSAIYGNMTYAPYINGLLATAAHTTKFQDELPSLVSEPHYIFMEGGTNAFSDTTFSTDNNPSTSNSTASTDHLVTQLETAGLSWMSYQQGITAGTCPVASVNAYRPKHDPTVFFRDVSGSPPSSTSQRCIDHHKPYTAFAADLAAATMPAYVFITPDLCNDMHGDASCPQGTNTNANIQAGDTWLKNELPPILTYAQAHDSIVMITWDEGDSSNLISFLILGPRIKAGATSTVVYNHGSIIKTVEETFGLPILAKVTAVNDFSDMYQSGMFP
jgi:hypothetical protein